MKSEGAAGRRSSPAPEIGTGPGLKKSPGQSWQQLFHILHRITVANKSGVRRLHDHEIADAAQGDRARPGDNNVIARIVRAESPRTVLPPES